MKKLRTHCKFKENIKTANVQMQERLSNTSQAKATYYLIKGIRNKRDT